MTSQLQAGSATVIGILSLEDGRQTLRKWFIQKIDKHLQHGEITIS
jgi:hypothetical protein